MRRASCGRSAGHHVVAPAAVALERVEEPAGHAAADSEEHQPAAHQHRQHQVGALHSAATAASEVEEHAAGKAAALGRGDAIRHLGRGPAEDGGQPDAHLVVEDEGDHLEDQRQRVERRQQRGQHRDHHDRVAAALAQLLRARQPQLARGQDAHGYLEPEAHRQHEHRDERVVVAGPDLGVELVRVEVEEEMQGGPQHHEVTEHDARDEEHRDQQQKRQRQAALAGTERREQERVHLVEDERQ